MTRGSAGMGVPHGLRPSFPSSAASDAGRPASTGGVTASVASRLSRVAALAVLGLLLAFAAIEAAIVLPPALTSGLHVTWGLDLRPYLAHTDRWLAGGGFYAPEQLAGPYVVETDTGNVYPPVALYLLVPFARGLPWVLWWAVPTVIIAAVVAARRPSRWQLVALAAILVYPRTWTVIVLGNPAMWSLAFLAAGMVWRWPAAFVPLKLTFAPLALVGIRSRSWWLVAGVALALCLPFGALWLDYAHVLVNTHSSRGLEYVLGEWPIALLLVVGLWRPAVRP